MADFGSTFAPFPCSYLANQGGTNILLVQPNQCGSLVASSGSGGSSSCGCGGTKSAKRRSR